MQAAFHCKRPCQESKSEFCDQRMLSLLPKLQLLPLLPLPLPLPFSSKGAPEDELDEAPLPLQLPFEPFWP